MALVENLRPALWKQQGRCLGNATSGEAVEEPSYLLDAPRIYPANNYEHQTE